MKVIFCFLITFCILPAFSQTPEEAEAKKVVIDFFDAFHKQDSVALHKLIHPSIKMESISSNATGKNQLSTTSYRDFVRSIVSIPANTKFEEKLHSYHVQVNGPLATVVTSYTFHVNGSLSHCGVNSFTMVKEEKDWKITYIIDTRKKEGCDAKIKTE